MGSYVGWVFLMVVKGVEEVYGEGSIWVEDGM